MNRLSGGGQANSLPTTSCNAGYFNLFFAASSMFSTTAAQTVICQVFSDISSFIISPLSVGSNTVRINIYCDNTPANQPGAFGAATAFYVYPSNPTNPNQCYMDNQIEKTIKTGVDAYNFLPLSFVNASSFYHGMVLANPNLSSGNWHYNLSSTSLSNTDYDFYT
ncbi:MAG: hypothetical protein WCR21_11030, partial [Bacteroidota bacterium]